MEKYLNPQQYYEDIYDRSTVDFCRGIESKYDESIKDRIGKKINKKDRDLLAAYRLMIHFEIGERYLRKEDKIKEWMDRDRAKDKLLETAIPPNDIYCNKCGEAMFVETKILHNKDREEKERVLFIFRCPSKCKDGRAIFNDGEEWIMEPKLCDKCGFELNKKVDRKGDKILTHYSCKECGFKKTEELDLSRKEKEIDKFYNRDRARFCLNEKKGQAYCNEKIRMKQLCDMVEGTTEKDKNKELYERVSKLKKLTVFELEKRLTPVLKKEGYIKFELGKPEIGRDVFIEFSTQDENSGREEYESSNNLKKIIKKTLENTNWRLMSEGIHYRLGFLNGRVRGYEKEEDLIKLVKK